MQFTNRSKLFSFLGGNPTPSAHFFQIPQSLKSMGMPLNSLNKQGCFFYQQYVFSDTHISVRVSDAITSLFCFCRILLSSLDLFFYITSFSKSIFVIISETLKVHFVVKRILHRRSSSYHHFSLVILIFTPFILILEQSITLQTTAQYNITLKIQVILYHKNISVLKSQDLILEYSLSWLTGYNTRPRLNRYSIN